MKVLKIDNEECYYSLDGTNYESILDIGKDDIYKILNYVYEGKGEIDEYTEDLKIKNEVERLIYKDLFVQINNFKENIPALKQEINEEFKEAFEKYNVE